MTWDDLRHHILSPSISLGQSTAQFCHSRPRAWVPHTVRDYIQSHTVTRLTRLTRLTRQLQYSPASLCFAMFLRLPPARCLWGRSTLLWSLCNPVCEVQRDTLFALLVGDLHLRPHSQDNQMPHWTQLHPLSSVTLVTCRNKKHRLTLQVINY